jgi:hypothetical protein
LRSEDILEYLTDGRSSGDLLEFLSSTSRSAEILIESVPVTEIPADTVDRSVDLEALSVTSRLAEILRESLTLFKRLSNVALEFISTEFLPRLRLVADSVTRLFVEIDISEDRRSSLVLRVTIRLEDKFDRCAKTRSLDVLPEAACSDNCLYAF